MQLHLMVKTVRLEDAFSEDFELEASSVEGKSLQQKDNKSRKRKAKNVKNQKPKEVF